MVSSGLRKKVESIFHSCSGDSDFLVTAQTFDIERLELLKVTKKILKYSPHYPEASDQCLKNHHFN